MWCGGSSTQMHECEANDSGHANRASSGYYATLWRFTALNAVLVDCLRPCECGIQNQA